MYVHKYGCKSTCMNNYLTIYPYGLNLKYFNVYVHQTVLNENYNYIYNNIDKQFKNSRNREVLVK